MSRSARDVEAVLTGRRPPVGQTSGPVEGRVHSVTADGLKFTLPDWDGGRLVFGPCPWPMSRVEAVSDGDGPHDHPETVPVAGWRCLVVFVGAGIDRPWCVGLWP